VSPNKFSMKPGRELDQRIAEKVMDWTLENYETCQPARTVEEYARASRCDEWAWSGRDGEAWEFMPSENIAHAWEVVEKLDSLGALVCVVSQYDILQDKKRWLVAVTFIGKKEVQCEPASMSEIPHAICLCALKAVGA
jgi:hypothetical protein